MLETVLNTTLFSAAWYPSLSEEKVKTKLQALYNKCIIFCWNIDYWPHIFVQEFEKLNWLSVSIIQWFQVCQIRIRIPISKLKQTQRNINDERYLTFCSVCIEYPNLKLEDIFLLENFCKWFRQYFFKQLKKKESSLPTLAALCYFSIMT